MSGKTELKTEKECMGIEIGLQDDTTSDGLPCIVEKKQTNPTASKNLQAYLFFAKILETVEFICLLCIFSRGKSRSCSWS